MELGHHLLDLPIEMQLAKMVLCSVVLKCVDPALGVEVSEYKFEHFSFKTLHCLLFMYNFIDCAR